MSGQTVISLTEREGREVAVLYPAEFDARQCGAESPVWQRRCYTCTREPHDDGPHVAHVPDGSAVVLWTRAAPAAHRTIP